MDDIIAERELIFRRNGSDVDESVVVRIGRPRIAQHAPAYTAPIEIEGPDGHLVSFYSTGEDSMQALALVFIGIHGHLDSIKRAGKLTWLDSEELNIPSGK